MVKIIWENLAFTGVFLAIVLLITATIMISPMFWIKAFLFITAICILCSITYALYWMYKKIRGRK